MDEMKNGTQSDGLHTDAYSASLLLWLSTADRQHINVHYAINGVFHEEQRINARYDCKRSALPLEDPESSVSAIRVDGCLIRRVSVQPRESLYCPS